MTPSLASMRWMVGSDSPDKLGKLALVDPEERARRAKLGAGNHVWGIRIRI